jgi:hypothetical protein
MTVGIFNGRGSGRFQFGRDKYASHATISLRKDHRRSDQDDGDDGSNCEPISAGRLWYQRRWRKEKWTSLFVAVARPVQAGAGQAERRPGAARPDCVPHATAADVGGNASLRDVQVNTMAVGISTTKTVLSCRQHYHRQSCRSLLHRKGRSSFVQQHGSHFRLCLNPRWEGVESVYGRKPLSTDSFFSMNADAVLADNRRRCHRTLLVSVGPLPGLPNN